MNDKQRLKQKLVNFKTKKKIILINLFINGI